MIEAAFGFIAGFVVCLALWIHREIERLRAFGALLAENEMLRAKVSILKAGLTRVQERAKQLKKTMEFGEPVTLPSPARRPKALVTPEANGQLSHLNSLYQNGFSRGRHAAWLLRSTDESSFISGQPGSI